MYCDFECNIKNKKHIPIACGLYIKSDYSDTLEDMYESYSGEDIVDWFISRVNPYKKNYLKIYLKLIFPLMKILLLHLLLSVSIVKRTWVMTLLEIMIV